MVVKRSFIEKLAEGIGIIPKISNRIEVKGADGELQNFPSPSEWDNHIEFDAQAWPNRIEKNYSLVPTTCFNCESACGLLAYVDKETETVTKFEGNPHHPGSRGRNCAKGPATINQIKDTERILYPLRRKGPRGSGEWEQITWDTALDEIAAKIRTSLKSGAKDKVVYHVGRPGHEGYANRVLKAWGVDGHNSHTNICSGGARTGYAIWHKYDRPSPDHANAKVILLTSSHLETGHYFNPHAQRIMEGMMAGAKLIVIDPRLSNTASMADEWVPTYPGSEPALFLAIARHILESGKYDREFMEKWTNWDDWLKADHPDTPQTFETFIELLIAEYQCYSDEFAAEECQIPIEQVKRVAELVADAGSQLSTHVWRSAAIGNLGGWQAARTLHFLNVLTGSVGTEGGTSPSAWNKFQPEFFDVPEGPDGWNELHFPPEYTLNHYEMSHILPHLVKEGRGAMDVYFSRVFNPVWTFPDGFSWIDMFENEDAIGCHIALTPTWNETAFFADYVLPMGHSSERHDLNSYETHAGKWIAFRQPVLREYARRQGKDVEFTHEINPGQVWEEDEFWIELSWRIDDGTMGIREHFISPYREGEKINIDEYYQYIFDRVPGLKEKAELEGLGPLEFMKKHGAFLVDEAIYKRHEDEVKEGGIIIDGKQMEGWPTPSKKQEFYSQTMIEFGYPEHAIPHYRVKSHIHPDFLEEENAYCLLPNFRLPTHIHSRSANSKWLAEIAHRNPVWMHPIDANNLGVADGDLIKVQTEIGFFIDKVWITEGIKPGVVGCSHHIGRWRRKQDQGNRLMTNEVNITKTESGSYRMETVSGIEPWESNDADTNRVWWRDGGVHQNITHAVQPDPISGHHCWLQKVLLSLPAEGEKYGDIEVDPKKSFAYYQKWNQWAKDKETHPRGERRPLWFKRPLQPKKEHFYIKEDES
ncbi:MAG TPA: formate dehydrogenase [Candidatus Poseidoniales archaeon]|nr:MAG: formate dehydrogenase [Euryarchaeota archaeon]HIG03726.1 formate dehydrogenase [Candidatus Poseidoniales archaeon]HIK78170.1 formate dehydrogenase [Candidatus Poseidoniales archaeon]